MASIIIYLMEVSFRLAILYLLFRFLYRNSSFHKLNRFVLLSVVIFSFVFIRIDFHSAPDSIVTNNSIVNSINYIDNSAKNLVANNDHNSTDPNFNWIDLIAVIYFTGFAIFLMKAVISFFNLIYLRKKSDKQVNNRYIYLYADVSAAFSFFNMIFIPKKQKGNVHPLLFEHEYYHIKHYHSIDLMITELAAIILWFNPLIYFIKKDIRAIHEFQVDNAMLKNKNTAIDYLQLIMTHTLEKYRQIGLYNYFNGLTIKKRMEMINKKKNSALRLMAYLIVLPTIFFMCVSFVDNSSGDDLNNQLIGKLPESINETFANMIIYNDKDSIPSISPVDKKYRKNTIKFGMRTHPILNVKKFHKGIDIVAKRGVPVKATADGYVMKTDYHTGYGIQVKIRHSSRFETRYAQLQKKIVKEGQQVKKGEVIGYVGSTGLSTAPHLHYEVIVDGKVTDPEGYIN